MDDTLALASFLALSNATRLKILKCLVAAGPDGMLAGDVAVAVEATPSRASFHLTNLHDTGMITSTRMSRQISYAVNYEAVGELMKYLLQDCCQNNETVRTCCTSSECC
jgi:ArsR family transcriptional regulator, arsenate/arsenite/antimonite-responsive transcriptional repressor